MFFFKLTNLSNFTGVKTIKNLEYECSEIIN